MQLSSDAVGSTETISINDDPISCRNQYGPRNLQANLFQKPEEANRVVHVFSNYIPEISDLAIR
jgi:hypothetical protein